MPRTVEVQPWTVLQGTASNYEIVQEVPDWVDAVGHDVASTTLEIVDLAAATLQLEGCDDINGMYTALESHTAALSQPSYRNLLRVQPMGSPERLYNHLRWRVTPTAANWRVTFRINAILK